MATARAAQLLVEVDPEGHAAGLLQLGPQGRQLRLQGLRPLDAEKLHEGDLLRVLARVLPRLLGSAQDVQEVVGDLEGQPQRLAVLVEPVERGAEVGTCARTGCDSSFARTGASATQRRGDVEFLRFSAPRPWCAPCIQRGACL
mgnify:CR=1 FL=1